MQGHLLVNDSKWSSTAVLMGLIFQADATHWHLADYG
jgi:hypothetical protein